MSDLVSEARKGNKEAFLKLVEGRLDVLYKISCSYFGNSCEASDAVQDAILFAHKNIRKLKDSGKFNSWITSILVNRCRELLRKSRKFRFVEYSEEVVGAEYNYNDDYSGVETSIDVLGLLQKIDGKYREVITLKYFGDYSINEIAEIMEIPQGTVKSRLNFGLNRLKQLMEVAKSGM